MPDDFEQWLENKIEFHQREGSDYARAGDVNGELLHFNKRMAYKEVLKQYLQFRDNQPTT